MFLAPSRRHKTRCEAKCDVQGHGTGRASGTQRHTSTGRQAASGSRRAESYLSVFLVVLATLSTGDAFAGADPTSPRSRSEHQFVDGLLARQLFSLAEAHCKKELARTDITIRRRAELAVELSRTHALRAIFLPSATREVAWQSAFDPLAAFRKEHPTGSYLLLTRRQEALVHRARGDLLRQEAEVVTIAAPLRQRAQAELRKAVAKLSELEESLTASIGEYYPPEKGEPPRLTDGELRNLREEVRYQLARTLVSQGLTYPAGSADRTNSIVRAKKQYAPLAERDEPIDWDSRLALARCERLLQAEAVARQRLAPLITDGPPRIIDAAKLELARLNYDVGRPEVARKTLQDRTTHASIAAEWDYEYLRTLLAVRAAEKEPQSTRRLLDLINDLVRVIEREHGAYWLRRAEALLGRHISESSQGQDAEMLARAAANFYRSDKPDDAIAAYDRAAEHARTAGSETMAFDLSFTAASIEHRRKQHDTARDRFRRTAMAYPEHARAAQAHLLALFNAAQLVRGGGKAALDQYVELLEEHLAAWPSAETAAQANIWLGNVRRAHGDWSMAIQRYRDVPPDSPLFTKAIDAMVKTTAEWLASFQADDSKRRPVARKTAARKKVARKAVAFYTKLLLAGRSDLSHPLNKLQRKLLLAWASTQMVYLQEGYDEMEQLLRVSLKSAADDATPEWKASARALLVLALAGQPRCLYKANLAAGQLAGADGETLIELVLALNVLRAVADGKREQKLAELQLSVVEQFEKILQDAKPAVRRRLNLARAAALVEAKRYDKALKRYAELAKKYPNDADVQLRYAEVLSHPKVAKDKADWLSALTQWRQIERRSDKATAAWFDAKYHQALAHHKIGNSKQALRIIQLTSALHPELGGADQKRRFEDLKRECEG